MGPLRNHCIDSDSACAILLSKPPGHCSAIACCCNSGGLWLGVAYEGIPIARDVARVQSTAQPLSGAVQFERNGEAARQQLIKDAERIGQAMMERATAQDRQIGGGNKTSLVMTAIANAPYVSAVCVAE